MPSIDDVHFKAWRPEGLSRNLRHIHLRELGTSKRYRAKGGSRRKVVDDIPDRVDHARRLLRAIDDLPNARANDLPGLYIEIRGKPNAELKRKSLEVKEMSLLRCKTQTDQDDNREEIATIFTTQKGITQLRKKVVQFETENNSASSKADSSSASILLPCCRRFLPMLRRL